MSRHLESVGVPFSPPAYADAGGYDMEVVWDTCATAALGLPYDAVRERPVSTLSGGEQKRIVLEALLRGPDQVLLLDEPDNYLDVPAKLWLEDQLRATSKTVLLVSHDRQLLANATDRIVTVEARGVWVHGAGFATYAQGRQNPRYGTPVPYGWVPGLRPATSCRPTPGPTCTAAPSLSW